MIVISLGLFLSSQSLQRPTTHQVGAVLAGGDRDCPIEVTDRAFIVAQAKVDGPAIDKIQWTVWGQLDCLRIRLDRGVLVARLTMHNAQRGVCCTVLRVQSECILVLRDCLGKLLTLCVNPTFR